MAGAGTQPLEDTEGTVTIRASPAGYLKSIADELTVQANRVRDLIGSVHWLSDGHHKEYLVTALLQRHLPSGLAIGRGFVIDPTDHGRCSREQDVLVVDSTRDSPLFCQGGLLVAFPQAVVASLSVKTRMDTRELRDTVDCLRSVREVCFAAGYPGPWTAGVFFEPGDSAQADPAKPYGILSACVNEQPWPDESKPGPDLLVTPHTLAYKCVAYTDQATGAQDVRVFGYECGGAATGLLVALAAQEVAASRGHPRPELGDYLDDAAIRPLQPEPMRVLKKVG
jgi:hypothetical protein